MRRPSEEQRTLARCMGAVGLFALACSTGGTRTPLPLRLEARAIASEGIELPPPLRSAVLWVFDAEAQPDWLVTDDRAVSSLDEIGFELSMPDAKRWPKLTPEESLTFVSAPRVSAKVYRPHLLLYRDLDDNQRFNANLFERTGPDEVLAQDEFSGVAAVLDLEALLERLPEERSEFYYRATGGRYTHFVKVNAQGSTLQVLAPDVPVQLLMGSSALNLALIECSRPAVLSSAVVTTLTVADGLDLNEFCDITRSDCQSRALDELKPPPVPPDEVMLGAATTVTCRARGDVQSLVLSQSGRSCEECRCRNEFRVDIYLADATNLPAWWPCGETVEICRSGAALTQPGGCAPLADAGLDAGASSLEAGSDANLEDASLEAL